MRQWVTYTADFAKAEIVYGTLGLVKSNISPDRMEICRNEKVQWNLISKCEIRLVASFKLTKPLKIRQWLVMLNDSMGISKEVCESVPLRLLMRNKGPPCFCCTQDFCPCSSFDRGNMGCLYMRSTFLWSCTADTLLFVQPVKNVFWPRKLLLIPITPCPIRSVGLPLFQQNSPLKVF